MGKIEGFTHLYADRLERKDNPLIVFRGKLDTLCAMIMEAQLLGENLGNASFSGDLQEILDFTRSILPAEFRGEPMGEFVLLGLTHGDLRERSRNPARYFRHGHLFMDKSMGALCLRLNLLRTFTRETELAAVTAFRDTDGKKESIRPDIIEALNALSSLFYVLTYKYLPEGYTQKGDAGI
jgi:ethanolamine utilization cobalamin adenosyltransferase